MEQRLGPEEQWTPTNQLLALMIEVQSIGVAGKQIKKPIDIPRPGKKGGADRGQRRHPDDQGAVDQQQPRPLRPPAQPPSRQVEAGPSDPYKKGIAVLRGTAKPRRQNGR